MGGVSGATLSDKNKNGGSVEKSVGSMMTMYVCTKDGNSVRQLSLIYKTVFTHRQCSNYISQSTQKLAHVYQVLRKKARKKDILKYKSRCLRVR